MVRDMVTAAFEVAAMLCLLVGVGLVVDDATGRPGVALLAAGVVALGESYVLARRGGTR